MEFIEISAKNVDDAITQATVQLGITSDYSQVKNLRRKLEEAGASIEIKAVYGFGYKLID